MALMQKCNCNLHTSHNLTFCSADRDRSKKMFQQNEVPRIDMDLRIERQVIQLSTKLCILPADFD